ncbi:uncharacterized protein C1orf228 homolog isoform X2 [Mizuhopecten yessoensis]|uniref:uncharacterized protein C1orf228 homolog isoform X2 n=1 Tax=Mizuhopecten yessoensis TaxID=6573 RepID=UPI000B457E67|nr:uncharacterized protein C1orf228 homolog isoform X2 [Mizuhopecten yessoensis]
MGSAKQQSAISKVMNLLQEWDKGSKAVRGRILKDFISQNQNKTGPELEQEFAQAASLFLARLTAWLRLTYMIGTSLNDQLRAISIFLSASSGHKFMAEFLEVGGVLTLLEIIGLKQAKEADKLEALKCLQAIANAGRKYKELICESYGIRAVAECLAKSKTEETQDACRNLLLMLAQGNPKFQTQVYKGLIALLPCSSPKAQQMAAQSLRTVQPIVQTANVSIVEPLLNLLKTLHLEVQFEGVELIKELMAYDEVADLLQKGLVGLLHPSKEDTIRRPEILEDPDVPKINAPLPVYVQQAAAAKTIGILERESNEIAEKLIQLKVTHNLLYAMGNMDHADSQRQSSMSLESNPESLYMNMTHIQADVLVSNKVNIPNVVETVD